MWYFPTAAPEGGVDLNGCATGHCGSFQNKLHNKYFLMNSRYERAGTLGFRCAADVPGNQECKGRTVCNTLNRCTCVITGPL